MVLCNLIFSGNLHWHGYLSLALWNWRQTQENFQDIYFSVEDVDGIGVLYTKTGEYSAILKMENPVQKYSANIDSYYEFNHFVSCTAQTLGEGYAIHKQDVFTCKQFQDESNDNHEFLSESYFKYFNGRSYTDSQTYLIITQENKKSRSLLF